MVSALIVVLLCPVLLFQNQAGAKKSKVTLFVGGTQIIKTGSLNKKIIVTWKLSNKGIVKIIKKKSKGVGKYAKIKGLKEGKATLMAIYKKGSKKKTMKWNFRKMNYY